jgi:hypothetical protein
MRSAPSPPPSRGSVLAAAARRFTTLLLGVVGVTLAGSLVLGLALGASTGRAVSIGLYLVGSFFVVAGFVLGNRGPARMKPDDEGLREAGRRRMRWATRDERLAAINESAIFVTLGFVLIVLGVLVDARVRLL